MKAEIRTETLKVMNEDVEVKKVCSIYIKIGDEEIKISSGESTIKKLIDAEEKLKAQKEAAKQK